VWACFDSMNISCTILDHSYYYSGFLILFQGTSKNDKSTSSLRWRPKGNAVSQSLASLCLRRRCSSLMKFQPYSKEIWHECQFTAESIAGKTEVLWERFDDFGLLWKTNLWLSVCIYAWSRRLRQRRPISSYPYAPPHGHRSWSFTLSFIQKKFEQLHSLHTPTLSPSSWSLRSFSWRRRSPSCLRFRLRVIPSSRETLWVFD
jgi:hypothetical protein